jgi:hypothetical protein
VVNKPDLGPEHWAAAAAAAAAAGGECRCGGSGKNGAAACSKHGRGGGGGEAELQRQCRCCAKEGALKSHDGPSFFAVPGNHDWIDGLDCFQRHIQHKGWIGGWLMPQVRWQAGGQAGRQAAMCTSSSCAHSLLCSLRAQACYLSTVADRLLPPPYQPAATMRACLPARLQEKSYFAVRLPHGWWLFGLDLALVDDIDMCQYRWVGGRYAGSTGGEGSRTGEGIW